MKRQLKRHLLRHAPRAATIFAGLAAAAAALQDVLPMLRELVGPWSYLALYIATHVGVALLSKKGD